MELRQLESFIAVCEELHFTRAAEKLGMTQPTLSYQIKTLEDEIGVPLFDRVGKKIAITEAGTILYKECNTIFNSLKITREHISELKKLERGTLTVGTLPGELNKLASGLLLDFHRNHPEIKIKILGADNVVERILQNEIDLAITILQFDDERIITIPLYFESFYLAVSADHPLAVHEQINFNDLKTMPIIMFPDTHQCRKLVDKICSNAGFSLDPLIETSTIESIISIVQGGTGATILSKTLLEMFDDHNLKVIPIENPNLIREIGLIYRKDKYVGFAAREFIHMLTSRIKDLKENNLEDIVPIFDPTSYKKTLKHK